MNTKEALNRFEEVSATYIEELERFDLEQLTRKPDENEWSLGQMYMHLINSALYMQLHNVEVCRSQVYENVLIGEEKTEDGKAIFAKGSFPPIRIKVPASKEYTPPQPESKEQILNDLQRVIQKMREVEPMLDTIPLSHTVRHPRLGALHAQEWYILVDMHYRHHLRQKERLASLL